MAYAEVIGDPIAHSKSPLIHRRWLARAGIEADYRATRVTAGDLGSYLESRRGDADWRGCNVTRPLKTRILEHVDALDETARRVGAVNLVTRDAGGRLVGGNQDVAGIAGAIGGSAAARPRVVIIGAGGAARAAALYAASLEPVSIVILARRPEQGKEMLRSLGLSGRVCEIGAVPAAGMLINATPSLGPWDIAALPAGAVVLDMVYDPIQTPLLVEARKRGMTAIGGLSMLVHQARGSFAALFGAPSPPGEDAELEEMP